MAVALGFPADGRRSMYTLQELAELVGGKVKGNPGMKITGYCSLESPSPSAISYMEKGKDAAKLSNIMLGALVTTEALSEYFPDVILHPNPRLSFVDIMDHFDADLLREDPQGFIHPSAVVDPSATVADSAQIGANAVVGPEASIGALTKIGAGTVVGNGSRVGNRSMLHANVTVYHNCAIGNRVIIHSGTIIGSDGFGFIPTKEGHRKFRQVGSVLIEDDVEIGANCCIDRGALDETVIHAGTKLDNLVQIAHGVNVGHHTVIAAQTGVSGSTRIGSWCLIGGQAGFQGHITIGDQSIVAAQSGVFADLPFKSKVSGYPAKPHGQSLKVLALTFKLPELVEKVKSLEIELDLIRGELKGKAKRERGQAQGRRNPGSPAGEA